MANNDINYTRGQLPAARVGDGTIQAQIDAANAAVSTKADATATSTAITGLQTRQRGAAWPLAPACDRLIWPNQNLSDGTKTSVTYRSRHRMTRTLPFIRILYTNFGGPNGAPTNPITVKASIDNSTAGTATNSITPAKITFDGYPSTTIERGGFALSDPIYGPFTAQGMLLIRTNVSVVTLGQKWPIGITLNRGFEGALDTDKTESPNFSTSFVATSGCYAPVCVGAADAGFLTVAGIGDSIMDGAGDSATGFSSIGFLARACGEQQLGTVNCGYLRVSQPGETALTASTVSTGANVSFVTRAELVSLCAAAVCNYGTNDIGTGAALAVVQSSLIALWNTVSLMGTKIWQTTITPRTTSTNSWATTGAQTVTANEGVRTSLNSWLRDGAPVNASLVAVATGSNAAGTLRAGTTGHPLTGVFDVAAQVEVNSANTLTLNGGFWMVNAAANYPTTDGIHPSSAMATLMANAVSLSAMKIATGTI